MVLSGVGSGSGAGVGVCVGVGVGVVVVGLGVVGSGVGVVLVVVGVGSVVVVVEVLLELGVVVVELLVVELVVLVVLVVLVEVLEVLEELDGDVVVELERAEVLAGLGSVVVVLAESGAWALGVPCPHPASSPTAARAARALVIRILSNPCPSSMGKSRGHRRPLSPTGCVSPKTVTYA